MIGLDLFNLAGGPLLAIFWWMAEREILELHRRIGALRTEAFELKGRISDLTDPDEDEEDWPLFVAGDTVEVVVGSVIVKGKFVGVTVKVAADLSTGQKLLIQTGNTVFSADPDDVSPSGEPAKGYRDLARNLN